MDKNLKIKALGVILLLTGSGILAQGAIIVLAPAADTSLYEQSPDNNLGALTNCAAGSNTSLLRSRALVRFNLAGQLPANAVVLSVALTVNVIVVPNGGGTASTFDLRRMLVDWTEGTGLTSSGQAAKTGESTWNRRAHPAVSWSTPGGAIGTEYSSTVSGTVAINAIGGYTFVSTSNLVADVQQWLLNPGTNFGWAVLTESENGSQTVRRFASRENSANAPALSITYTVPPAAPAIQNVALTNNQFQFTFSAAAGQTYYAQYVDFLPSGVWSNFATITPQSVATNILVTDSPATNQQRFYRVIAPY